MRKPYPSYKDSKVEWIGKIPSHWNLSRIKHLTQIEMGQSPSSNSYNDEAIGMSFLQGNSEFGTEYPIEKKWTTEVTKISKFGDILFSVRGSVAEINWSDKEYCIGRGLCAIRPINYNPKFLWYFLLISKDEFLSLSVGSTFLSVSTDDILNFILLNIPQTEQKQIVEYLDYKTGLIDELIEKTIQKIELLKEKRTSLINHCVTKGLNPDVEMKDSGVEWIGKIPRHWKVKKIKNILKEDGFRSGPFGSSLITDKLDNSGDYLVYSPEYLTDKIIEYPLYVPLQREEELLKYLIKEGDIVLPIVGTLGRTKLFTKSDKKGILNQRLCRISPDPDKIFVLYLLKILTDTQLIKVQIEIEKKGSILDHITREIIVNLIFTYPPIYEQQQIVEYIDSQTQKIDALIEKENKRIKLLKEYRQSLISEAVTGKIDIRDEVAV